MDKEQKAYLNEAVTYSAIYTMAITAMALLAAVMYYLNIMVAGLIFTIASILAWLMAMVTIIKLRDKVEAQ